MQTAFRKRTPVFVAISATALGLLAHAGSGSAAGSTAASPPRAMSIESTMQTVTQPGSSIPVRVSNTHRLRASELLAAYPGIPRLPCTDATELVCAEVAGRWNLPPPAPNVRQGAPVVPTPEPPAGLL